MMDINKNTAKTLQRISPRLLVLKDMAIRRICLGANNLRR